jgi:hypothetical protein
VTVASSPLFWKSHFARARPNRYICGMDASRNIAISKRDHLLAGQPILLTSLIVDHGWTRATCLSISGGIERLTNKIEAFLDFPTLWSESRSSKRVTLDELPFEVCKGLLFCAQPVISIEAKCIFCWHRCLFRDWDPWKISIGLLVKSLYNYADP